MIVSARSDIEISMAVEAKQLSSLSVSRGSPFGAIYNGRKSSMMVRHLGILYRAEAKARTVKPQIASLLYCISGIIWTFCIKAATSMEDGKRITINEDLRRAWRGRGQISKVSHNGLIDSQDGFSR